MKLRIRFEKTGAVRFTSHKDVVRIFQRCFAAGGIPILYSEGFHPHMRMSFGPPLKTGWESHAEYMDIDVQQPVGHITAISNRHLPDGLRISFVSPLADRAPKLANDLSASELEVIIEARDVLGDDASTASRNGRRAQRLDRLSQDIMARFAQPEAEDTPRVMRSEVSDEGEHVVIRYTSTMHSGRFVSPTALVAETIGDPDEFEVPIAVRRLEQFVERDGELVLPTSKGAIQPKS